MRDKIDVFLLALDEALQRSGRSEPFEFILIGRSALIHAGLSRSITGDVDVLIDGPQSQEQQALLAQFGRTSENARLYDLYLEFVPAALPPMPGGYKQRVSEIHGSWKIIKVFSLEVHDLAISKLKRFVARDREDIRTLCDIGLLDSDVLLTRLESAFRYHLEKDGNPDRDRAFANLRTVQSYLAGEIREF